MLFKELFCIIIGVISFNLFRHKAIEGGKWEDLEPHRRNQTHVCSRAAVPDILPFIEFLRVSDGDLYKETLDISKQFIESHGQELWVKMANHLERDEHAILSAQGLEMDRLHEFISAWEKKQSAMLQKKYEKAYQPYNRLQDKDLAGAMGAQRDEIMKKEFEPMKAQTQAWLAKLRHAHNRQTFELCYESLATLCPDDPLAIALRENRHQIYSVSRERLFALSEEAAANGNITESEALLRWAQESAHKMKVYGEPIQPGTPVLYPYPLEIEWQAELWD